MVNFAPEAPQLLLTEPEVRLSSIVMGASLGIGFFTIWHAVEQTRFQFSAFNVLVWVGLIAGLLFTWSVYFYLMRIMPYNIGTILTLCVTWAVTTQCVLQIIVTRICLLYAERSQRIRLRTVVAVIATTVDFLVIPIWAPAMLAKGPRWALACKIVEYIDKAVFLFMDGYLNFMFIKLVKERLVRLGLKKYDSLVSFNTKSAIFSVFLDCVLMGLMGWSRAFESALYAQCVGLVYIIKLNIELSLSAMLIEIVSHKNDPTKQLTAIDGVRIHTQTEVAYEENFEPAFKRKGDKFRMYKKNNDLENNAGAIELELPTAGGGNNSDTENQNSEKTLKFVTD